MILTKSSPSTLVEVEKSDTRLLIGSLSNDLFRVATLTQRGSTVAATRFLQEAKRWSQPLLRSPLPDYIQDIVRDVAEVDQKAITLEATEKYLMYGVQLQNYALHMR